MTLDLVQWPAMVITVVAAYLVASRSARRRKVGFWCFLASNVAWIVWGMHAGAYALIVLQVALAALNFRGVHKNEQVVESEPELEPKRAAEPPVAPQSA
jgi:hypothetical protein